MFLIGCLQFIVICPRQLCDDHTGPGLCLLVGFFIYCVGSRRISNAQTMPFPVELNNTSCFRVIVTLIDSDINLLLNVLFCVFVCAAGVLQGGEDTVHSGPQPVAHHSAHQHRHHLFVQVNTHSSVHRSHTHQSNQRGDRRVHHHVLSPEKVFKNYAFDLILAFTPE